MKIAYCFYGNVAGLTKKAGEKTEGSEKVLELSYKSFLENISCDDTIDFFIHSWNVEFEDIFQKYYSPKVLLSESQKIFDVPTHLPNNLRTQSHYSRWYSIKKIIEEKNKYCEINNEKYDLIVLARHDLFWLKKFDFNNISNVDINFDQCYSHGREFSTKNHVGDRLICANSENMNYLSELYDKLGEYTVPGQCPQYGAISSHFCIPWHLKNKELTDNIKFPYVWWGEGFTNKEKASFTLVRYFK